LLQSTHSNGLEAEHQLQAGKHTAVEKTKRDNSPEEEDEAENNVAYNDGDEGG
jgi:hypothetical protein